MFDTSKMPDSIFYKAVRNKDIIKCRILSDKEQLNYKDTPNFDKSKEILASNVNGKFFISRDDLVNTYRNLDGSKIKLNGWHYKTVYTLYRDINDDLYVLKLPSKLLKLNNRLKYCLLVFNVINNSIDHSKYTVVSTEKDLRLFRKTVVMLSKPNFKLAKQEIKNRTKIADMMSDREEYENKTYRNPLLEKKDTDVLVGAPYTVVMTLLRKNNVGKSVRVGYRVKRKKDNVERDCNFDSVKKMCINKEIDNLTIAIMQDTGKEYFRGVGIKVENLPNKYV